MDEIARAKKAYQQHIDETYQLGLEYSKKTNHLHPAVIGHETQHFIDNGTDDRLAVVTGGGGWTIGLFTGRYLRARRPGQVIVPAYQYGAIGPDMSMMMGACTAVQRGVGPQKGYEGAPTICVTSDAGVAYSMFELDTAAKYGLPTITIVYNNNAWGVDQCGLPARSCRCTLFQENLRYDQMAQGLARTGSTCARWRNFPRGPA